MEASAKENELIIQRGNRRIASNLRRDPVTGKIKGGPGRPKAEKFVLTKLAKNEIGKVFEMLGGAKGMYDWARSDVKHLTLFYTQVFTKMLSAQSVDAAAQKLSQRPSLTKIENVIIDPKNNYRSTMIDGEATEIADTVEEVNEDLDRVRREIQDLMSQGGAEEEQAEFLSSQMPIE